MTITNFLIFLQVNITPKGFFCVKTYWLKLVHGEKLKSDITKLFFLKKFLPCKTFRKWTAWNSNEIWNKAVKLYYFKRAKVFC